MLDVGRARQLLRDFQLRDLFIQELGWERHSQTLQIAVSDDLFTLAAIAHKRGMVAFRYDVPPRKELPEYAVRRKIERKVARSVHEHLIVYCDEQGGVQVWQWVKKELGKPLACREHHYHRTQTGEALIQKLQYIAFALEEEEGLGIVDVTSRVRAAFDVERVTRRFYDIFKSEHASFLDFIQGIPDEGLERWYASVMLNRLMFIYFIEKKGFLDGNVDYLSTKFQESKRRGKDRYYRRLLCPLFFEGFAKRPEDRSPDARAMLGSVPYLNGGIFLRHQVEELHGETIRIPDRAFEKLFAFFEQYQWHLDERPLRADNEINPDVLGYIFEKYINQKQMGAYYTKEDITGYIARNTVVPRLFDMAREKCKVAFEGEGSVWRLLQEDPDRYVYDAVKKGAELPLPAEIAVGIEDVSRRGNWNTPAPEAYALPTEMWREVVARRQRCEEVRAKLANGEVRAIDDLITLNLDIRQFAQDVVEDCSDPALLRAFWRSIAGWIPGPGQSNQEMVQGITILDPACGSGAFLFAALNILEPLYEACLDRMQAFLDEEDQGSEGQPSRRFSDFRRVLDQVAQHLPAEASAKAGPNRRYFVLKSIVVNNLYGVDIMEEAVEICKLRLFLKLVAQIEGVEEIEPLPDIDFSIRAGNTLVGFVSRAGVERAMRTIGGTTPGQQRLLSKEEQQELDALVEDAQVADRAFSRFQEMQARQGVAAAEFIGAKQELRSRLAALEARLDQYLAGEYGVSADDPEAYESWLSSHKPFHWLVDFYGIVAQGGFSVVLGNPPYVEYRHVKEDYQLPEGAYESERAGNLYAFFMERSGDLLSSDGWFGMIVPCGFVSVDAAVSIRRHFTHKFSGIACSTYSIRPSKLFQGVDQRLCICLASDGAHKQDGLTSSRYYHWHAEERPTLFDTICYARPVKHARLERIAQMGSETASEIIQRLEGHEDATISGIVRRASSPCHIVYHRSPRYWIRAMDFDPYFRSPTRKRSVYHIRDLYFRDWQVAKSVGALLNSSLFFVWFRAFGNGRNLTEADITEFPLGMVSDNVASRLSTAFDALMDDYRRNSFIRTRRDCEYQEFNPSLSKPIMDDIDIALAAHYGFTDEELDFIVNYDIKYRMGFETLASAENQ